MYKENKRYVTFRLFDLIRNHQNFNIAEFLVLLSTGTVCFTFTLRCLFNQGESDRFQISYKY